MDYEEDAEIAEVTEQAKAGEIHRTKC